MSDEADFRAASEAAHSWVNTVHLLARYGKLGRAEFAFDVLFASEDVSIQDQDDISLDGSYSQHVRILMDMSESLAVHSDGLIEWEHGRGLSAVVGSPDAVFKHCWTSAHEAAVEVTRLTLALLRPSYLRGITDPAERLNHGRQLLADHWKAFDLSLDEVSTWQARIRRERAKLIASLGSMSGTQGSITKSPTIPEEQPTIWYHGGNNYSIDQKTPQAVTNEQDDLLQKFLDQNVAFQTAILGKIVSNPSQVAKKLRIKFGNAVRSPGRFNKGAGYYIRVRSLPTS